MRVPSCSFKELRQNPNYYRVIGLPRPQDVEQAEMAQWRSRS
ncbi:MAG: hypothetical protein ACJ8AG_19360 [Ktedonobacteraceae bacterium]